MVKRGGGVMFAIRPATQRLATRGRGRPRQYGPGTAAGKRAYLAARKQSGSRVGSKLMYGKPSRQNLLQKVYNRGNGVPSESRLSLNAPPSARIRAMKKVGAPNLYETNGSSALVCQEGFQNASYVSWNSWDDLKAMQNHIPGSSSGVGFQGTARWVLEKMTGEVVYQNSSLATCYLELYDIVRKRDAVADLPADPTFSPYTAWSQGSYDVAQGVGSPALNLQHLKGSPFDSTIFKDYFKVIKRTKVCLTQGGVHRHAVNTSPNKLIDNSLLAYAQGDLKGLTHYTMAVVYGQPASVPSEGGTTVTTASIQLDIVQTLRYKYTWVSDTAPYMVQTDNLQSLTGEQIVSIGGGTIVPNAKA